MEIAKTLGLITVVGFGIQQFIELLDPWVWRSAKSLESRGWAPTNRDAKRWVAELIAVGIATVAVLSVDSLRLLSHMQLSTDSSLGPVADCVLSALVLAAGAEGTNTAQKYFSYVKEARKAATLASGGATRPPGG